MKKDITKRIDEFIPFAMASGAGKGAAKLGKRGSTGEIKKPAKGARLIVVGKEYFHWLFKGSKIIIWRQNGRKKVFKDLQTLTGMSWDAIDRASRKKYFSITPKFIEKIIKDHIL